MQGGMDHVDKALGCWNQYSCRIKSTTEPPGQDGLAEIDFHLTCGDQEHCPIAAVILLAVKAGEE
jgi:hypothetical protein